MYCYKIKKVENSTIYTDLCKFYRYIIIENISIPFCLKLGKGSLGGITDSEWQKLKSIFSEEELNKIFPLDLLWDQVKEC
jgi:hypothetical protein